MMKSLMKSLFLLVLAGSTLGGVQKRVYVDPGHPNLGGNAADNNGLHHVIVNQPACRLDLPCGGSLISPDWVITAAHCDGWFIRAVLNSHPDYAQRQVWKISEKHYFIDNGREHDLMLLRLVPGQRGQLHTIPLPPLPPQPRVAPARNDIVRFYGRRNAILDAQKMISIPADRLRFGDIPVVDCQPGRPNDCNPVRDCHYTPGFCICVQDPNVAVNRGDSGGSLVWRAPRQQHDTLYGVLNSAPIYLNGGSADFKDISNPLYRNWINRVTHL